MNQSSARSQGCVNTFEKRKLLALVEMLHEVQSNDRTEVRLRIAQVLEDIAHCRIQAAVRRLTNLFGRHVNPRGIGEALIFKKLEHLSSAATKVEDGSIRRKVAQQGNKLIF